jgi:hypothetical protein
LRAGYVICGICNRRLHVLYYPPSTQGGHEKPKYACRRRAGTEEISCNHTTRISLHILDKAAWEKAIEVLKNPVVVRAQVAKLREENKPVINQEDVLETIENIERQMANLIELAKFATNQETIDRLGSIMGGLEKQRREAQGMLYDIEEDDEERADLEEEIVKFEKWVEKVQPHLTDPTYEPTYEERRLAVRIIGVKAIVFPSKGDWPFRYRIDVTVPKIMEKMKGCIKNDQWQYDPTQSSDGDGT